MGVSYTNAVAVKVKSRSRILLFSVIGPVALLALTGGCASNHGYRLISENDSYHPVERPDANYTSGVSLMAYPSKEYERGDNKTVDKLNVFQFTDNSAYAPITLEYGLGQVIYTPDDIAVDSLDDIDRNGRPLRLDRPYAGFLFLQGAIHNHYGYGDDWTTDMRRSVSAKIGITGNGSLAEDVHTRVHESRDLIIPQGWGLQVGQEIGVTIGLEQRNRVLALIGKKWGTDVLTNIKASLGNVYTGFDAGVTWRIGLHLPRGHHQSSIFETFEAPAPPPELTPEQIRDPDFVPPGPGGVEPRRTEPETDPDWHIYGFVGQQSRWVFRDLSLDGRFFNSDPHTVQKEPLVNEFQYGFQFSFKEHWGLQALFAHRSDQLKDQRKEHSFGQFMLMYQHSFDH